MTPPRAPRKRRRATAESPAVGPVSRTAARVPASLRTGVSFEAGSVVLEVAKRHPPVAIGIVGIPFQHQVHAAVLLAAEPLANGEGLFVRRKIDKLRDRA